MNKKILNAIQKALSPDLLSKKYQAEQFNHPYAGHCYIATEAYFHACKNYHENLKAYVINLGDGLTHWFLRDGKKIIDVTAAQFEGEPIPYDKAKCIGFLTKSPSKRCQILLTRIGL